MKNGLLVLTLVLVLAGATSAKAQKVYSSNQNFLQSAYDNPRFTLLNGGLDATVLSLGRSKDHRQVTVTIRIHNGGRNIAYLALTGQPVATDNLGMTLNWGGTLSGIARCNGDISSCLGLHGYTAFPLQSYTFIEPGKSININLAFFPCKWQWPERWTIDFSIHGCTVQIRSRYGTG